MATPAKIVSENLPTVALVGRVNVGKSTLFNRIAETSQALVSNIPGTTRTRNIAVATWRGRQFTLVDTGGLTFDASVPLEKEIIAQTEIAIKEADVVVMVLDIQSGLLPQEKELAQKLRKNKKKLILVANKTDNNDWRLRLHDREWLRLGLGEPVAVSAVNGVGVGDLLDLVFKSLQQAKRRPKIKKIVPDINIAIIGKPNVGKSSLFNKLIGEERVIVSPMPHTTREPHDTLVEYQGQYLNFVDTAGIRRKTKVSGVLERAGIKKSLEMVNKSQIVLLVLDAVEPMSDQDKQLGGLLREHVKSVILVVNKWDQSDDNTDAFRNETKERIYAMFPHIDYAPIVFVSAKTGYRVHQIFDLILRAAKERKTVVDPTELAEFFTEITHKRLPTRGKGVRHPKILGFHQLPADLPLFEMAIKSKTSVHMSYVHYIANRLREKFGFFAAPIIIKLKKIKRI